MHYSLDVGTALTSSAKASAGHMSWQIELSDNCLYSMLERDRGAGRKQGENERKVG